MRNLKGKSADASGNDAIESFKDECLDTTAVGTWQKLSGEKLQISLSLYHEIIPQSRTGEPFDISQMRYQTDVQTIRH